MVGIKNSIIVGLDFLKKIPYNLSILSISILILYEIIYIETCFQYIIKILLIIGVSLLYFYFLYYLINRRFFFKIINPIDCLNFYINKGKSYLKKQIKDVFIEEFFLKYLPFLLLEDSINTFYWVIIILTAIVFTYIHKFNNLFSLLEFFIFFALCHFFFFKTHIFAVLFLPHLLRNLIIEYLTRHK